MECTSTCWFLESCIHKWNNPVPQQLPERAWLCRNPTRQSKCQSSPHNTSCGKKTTFFLLLRLYWSQDFLPVWTFHFSLNWNTDVVLVSSFLWREHQRVRSPYEIKRLHLVEAFGMSPFLVEQKSLIGAALFFGLDVEPALKKANREIMQKKEIFSTKKQTNLTYKTRYTKQTFTWEFKSKDVKPK